MGDSMEIFDRRLLRRRRDRAAAALAGHDFLFREVAGRLAERLDDVNRAFPLALDLGCHGGALAAVLGGRGGIQMLVQCDLSPAMARVAAAPGRPALCVDEEALPFAPGSFDLILSALSLHWVNDLPGALIQIRRALKPDGLFLGALFGGETLRELRTVFLEAEIAEEAGASPRISPFAEIREAGGLLQRAGFGLPVADVDSITVTYPDALALMKDLRAMGESNSLRARRRAVSRRATFRRAQALYAERFGRADGGLPATFQVLYLTAWAPDDSQPKALAPGSARARLAGALDSREISAGEKAGPLKRPDRESR